MLERLKPYAKVMWWLNVAALIASIWLYPADVSFFPLIVVLFLAFATLIAELGWYPYEGRWQVRYQVAFYVWLFILIIPANMLLASPAPSWYPTDSNFWIVIPVLGWGLLSVLRDPRPGSIFSVHGFFRDLSKTPKSEAEPSDTKKEAP
jgi:hypothetical protein